MFRLFHFASLCCLFLTFQYISCVPCLCIFVSDVPMYNDFVSGIFWLHVIPDNIHQLVSTVTVCTGTAVHEIFSAS